MARIGEFRTEAMLAEAVTFWLESLGFECWFEVSCTGGIADIVAVRGPVVWIVETKLALSLDLAGQCLERLREPATSVVAAVPYQSRSRGPRGPIGKLFANEGIGLVEFESYSSYQNANWQIQPRFRRMKCDKLKSRLLPEFQRNKPGTSGERLTRFSAHMQRLALELQPGRLVDVLKQSIPSFWAYKGVNWQTDSFKPTAAHRAALAYYLELKSIPGWTLVKENGFLMVVRTDNAVS